MKRARSFTFYEIIVGVAIVAIISVIAFRSYKEYNARANLGRAMFTMRNMIDSAIKYHQSKGTFNGGAFGTMPYDNINMLVNGDVIYNKYSVFDISYYSPAFWGFSTTGINNNDVLYFQGLLSGLEGIPGYTEPGPAARQFGNASVVSWGVKVQNGVYNVVCGRAGSNPSWNPVWDVPLSYLPSNCQCTNVYSWTLLGGSC